MFNPNRKEVVIVANGKLIDAVLVFQCCDCKQFFTSEKMDILKFPKASKRKHKAVLICHSCMDI